MRLLAANSKTVLNQAAAVSVAAFLFHRDQLPRTKLNVAVISGGNIDPQVLAQLLHPTIS